MNIKISLKFVPKGPVNNIPALVQIIAWRCPDDKPLSEPFMVQFTDAYNMKYASLGPNELKWYSEFDMCHRNEQPKINYNGLMNTIKTFFNLSVTKTEIFWDN